MARSHKGGPGFLPAPAAAARPGEKGKWRWSGTRMLLAERTTSSLQPLCFFRAWGIPPNVWSTVYTSSRFPGFPLSSSGLSHRQIGAMKRDPVLTVQYKDSQGEQHETKFSLVGTEQSKLRLSAVAEAFKINPTSMICEGIQLTADPAGLSDQNFTSGGTISISGLSGESQNLL